MRLPSTHRTTWRRRPEPNQFADGSVVLSLANPLRWVAKNFRRSGKVVPQDTRCFQAFAKARIIRQYPETPFRPKTEAGQDRQTPPASYRYQALGSASHSI